MIKGGWLGYEERKRVSKNEPRKSQNTSKTI